MADETDLRLFEIIYTQNHDRPMDFIQNEVYNAKKALLENDKRFHDEKCPCEHEEVKQNEGVEPVRIDEPQNKAVITRDSLVIKNPKKIKESIGDDEIVCCICGKKFQTLAAHVARTHGMTSKEYLNLVGLPEDTPLMSKNYYQKARAYAKNAFAALPRNRKAQNTQDTEIPEDEIQIDPPAEGFAENEDIAAENNVMADDVKPEDFPDDDIMNEVNTQEMPENQK